MPICLEKPGFRVTEIFLGIDGVFFLHNLAVDFLCFGQPFFGRLGKYGGGGENGECDEGEFLHGMLLAGYTVDEGKSRAGL